MRVLICGGRNFTDTAFLFRYMDQFHKVNNVAVVIQGEARGADTLGKEWARARQIPVRGFRAKWDIYGGKAGPIRNQQMLDEGKPDVVIAFEGGHGTAHMMRIARAAGVKVIEPNKKEPLIEV